MQKRFVRNKRNEKTKKLVLKQGTRLVSTFVFMSVEIKKETGFELRQRDIEKPRTFDT